MLEKIFEKYHADDSESFQTLTSGVDCDDALTDHVCDAVGEVSKDRNAGRNVTGTGMTLCRLHMTGS